MTDNIERPSSPEPTPALAPPGAGLPPLQARLLRHVLFPVFCRTTSWDAALKRFQREGDALLAMASALSPAQRSTRVLVRAPMGIEDSSRNWSAAMVLEHLIEVGGRIATGVPQLMQGQPVSVRADIVEVKPRGAHDADIVARYAQFLQHYQRTLAAPAGDRRTRMTLAHPWFGALGPHQWVCLGALHQQIHRRQMARIVCGLAGENPKPV